MAKHGGYGDAVGTVTLTATCACGERVTWPSDAPDEYIVRCKACGREFGYLGELRSQVDRTETEFKRGLIQALSEAWRKFRG